VSWHKNWVHYPKFYKNVFNRYVMFLIKFFKKYKNFSSLYYFYLLLLFLCYPNFSDFFSVFLIFFNKFLGAICLQYIQIQEIINYLIFNCYRCFHKYYRVGFFILMLFGFFFWETSKNFFFLKKKIFKTNLDNFSYVFSFWLGLNKPLNSFNLFLFKKNSRKFKIHNRLTSFLKK